MNQKKRERNINQEIKNNIKKNIKKLRIILYYMINRFLLKRFSNSYSLKSKCYENIHKIDSLREELNEIKTSIYSFNEPLKIIYISNTISIILTATYLFLK